MSKLEVDAIEPQSGTSLTLGASGDTITIPSGATLTNSGTATGFGKVLQVITATDSTSRSTSSTSFVTGSNTLSVAITPSSASNKIFVAVSSSIEGSGTFSFYYTIFRDAVNIGASDGMQRLYTGLYVPMAMSILDSPNTTSATTYQVYMKSNGGTASLNSGGLKGTITAFEIAG